MAKKGSTIKYLLSFILLIGLAVEGWGKVDKLRCMWRTDPATSMVIGWNQTSGSNPEICYGVVDGGVDSNYYPECETQIVNRPFKGMNNHFARLSNLAPDTEYYFIIVDSEGTSRRFSFRTASLDPFQRLSIVAGGDSRNYRGARVRANKMVAKVQPDFVLFGGDMTGGDTDREWRDWFDDWQHTISPEGRMTPIVAARGNHEYSNSTIAKLFDIVNDNVYYSLRFGGDLLEIYTLNSLIASGGNQKAWLANALVEAESTVQWKMAQYHYAIRPHTAKKKERNNQLENWGRLFHEHQMDLVFESDAHVVKTTWPVRPSNEAGSEEGFIRDDVNGTVYVGEGCWGAPLRRNNDDKSWTRSSGSFNQFKWVFVDRNGVEVRTVKTDNVDEVRAAGRENRFYPLEGMQIWEPASGPVIFIPARNNRLAALGNAARPHLVKAGMAHEMKLDQAKVFPNNNNSQFNFKWQISQQLYSNNGVFLIQAEKAEGSFSTLAKVKAEHGVETFDITLSLDQLVDAYRLVYSHPGRQSIVFPIEIEFPEAEMATASTALASASVDNTALRPDPNSGYLRVRYKLEESSDVDIKLVKKSRGEELLTSKYQNQRKGNYLKSIDMSDYPEGNYELLISINKEVYQEFQVTKTK